MNDDLDGSIESKTVGRFEKVLRTYWDGVPTPLFVAEVSSNGSYLTFALRLLGYSPDYHGETTEIVFRPATSSEFCSLSSRSSDSTPSTRIGNHYSPFVGTFSFVEHRKKKNEDLLPKTDALSTNNARIPLESCDQYAMPDRFTSYRKLLRMEKVVELYEPLVREYFPLPRDSLRRIIITATIGMNLESKEWVVSEVAVLTDEVTRWMSQTIYYYMCMNPLFRRMLEPLEARTEADRPPHKIVILVGSDRTAARASSLSARQSLLASLRWGKHTTGLFTALKILWDTRFAPLAFFNLSLDQTITDAEDFIAQITDSMRAAFTRLRLEFYAQAEDFFFTYIPDSKKTLFLNEEQVKSSHFNTAFKAMRIFLQNNLRSSVLQGLTDLVRFFDCDGLKGSQTTQRIALKHPLLKVDLIVGDNYLPRSPQFARLTLGLMELFDTAIEYANQLPQLDTAILRTLRLENRTLAVLCEEDVAALKTSLMSTLEEITCTVDQISSAYSVYSSLPVQELSTSFLTNSEFIEQYAHELRTSYDGVRRASPDRVYCGCVVIDSSAVKEEYCANWERTLNAFYTRLYSIVRQSVAAAEERVTTSLKKVEKAPATVKELEVYLANIAETASLSVSLREKDCAEVIRVFDCMEKAQIPIDPELYELALKLMRFSEMLEAVVAKAENAREDCRPLLLEKLKQLRKETRDNMQTLSTGITELYNMFNFEICDIAAQTCSELRELVEQINATVKSVFYQEEALNVKTVDTFEDLETLLSAFETIEQYWAGIYRSTTLREYYNSPVRSIDAAQMIESVRDWRRLIHAATRQVRAYPALVRLGKQQELALAKFEELEDLLRVITTPGLKKAHWKEIVRLFASKLKDDAVLAINMSLPLQKLIDAGIASFLPEITRIAAQARNDYDVENTLETMKSVAKKTHFQVIDWQVGFLSRARVSPASFKTILSMIEDFVTQCHTMRQKSGLSSLVVGMLTEWETATEKTRDIVLVWLQVEDQWDLVFPLLQNLSTERGNNTDTVWTTVETKLSLTRDAFRALYNMVSKPQFSLYTAVVQESISDFLLSAKNAMSDVEKMMTDALEQKRIAYPRFNFLTDSQLMTYLSPNNVDSLERLLPFMFANLCGIRIEDGAVVAFVTSNDACLEATQPVLITEEPVEVWMQTFESTLRASLLASVKQCLAAKLSTEVSVWISQFCAQTIELALRIEHTKGMREVLRLCGESGLVAHRTQLKNLLSEFLRLSASPGVPKAEKGVIATGVVYLKHAVSEVEHAIANHVTTVSDLDVTSMLQTFLGEDTIYIRFLGITCEYGFEFTGNPVHPMMGAVVETSLSAMTQIWLGRTAPVLSGLLKKESVLSFISMFLGRFVVPVQGNTSLSPAAARPLLRGCMQHGALLCVYACEALSHDLVVLLRECSEKVGNALLLEKPDPSTTVPVGPGGSTVSVSLSTHYGLVFCTNDYSSVPRCLSFYFRPIFVPPLRPVEMVRAYLDAFGLSEATAVTCQRFAALYDHFSEIDASTFSHRNLMLLLAHACSRAESGAPLERLCSAFVHIFYSFLRKDVQLRSLFEWHTRHILAAEDDSVLHHLPALLTDKPSDVTQRFDELMQTCRNVILVGPPFSGKSTMWRRHVGKSPFVALCPALMSAEEFYGTAERPGLLTTIAKRRPLLSGERQFIVMTEVNIAQCDWWLTWPSDTRVLSSETNYLIGPSTHLIVTTQTVEHMTPNVACDFVVFNLPQIGDWQRFLHRCLRGAPHADVASKLISTLLPILCAELQKRTGTGSPLNVKDPSFLAVCQHCADLYRRWHTYTQAQTIVESYFDDLLADPRLFAAQCATFAVCWNVGLGLPPNEQAHIKPALREAESAVVEAMSTVSVLDRVLPPLEDQDPSILHLLSTPRGWKTFEEANSCGFDLQWATHPQTAAQHTTSTPIFAAPSRQPTLVALQCLVDCGRNVLLTGLKGCGKSTVLSLTRLRERWVTLPVSANRGFSATSVQRGIADRLLLRSDGHYGPQPGRRLVVCIDDVHLCPLVGSDVSAASQLIAYCSGLGAICSPEEGFVPVADVGFLATLTETEAADAHRTAAVRFCTDVYLPQLTPDELAGGLWKLFDSACQRKRVVAMPSACSSFLVCAHAAFLRAVGQSGVASLNSAPSSSAGAAAKRTGSANAQAFLDRFAVAVQGSLCYRFKEVLAAADMARHQLLSSAPDVTVALNIATATTDMYASATRERHPEATDQLVQDLTQCATQSFGEVLRTTPAIVNANLDAAAQDHAEELPTREESNKVAEWIVEFELPGKELCETRLDAMYTRSAPSPFGGLSWGETEADAVSTLFFVRNTVTSAGSDSQNASRSSSVAGIGTTRSCSAGAVGRHSLSRRASMSRRGSTMRRGSMTRRNSSRSLRGSVQLDSVSISQTRSTLLSPTVQTVWLTRQLLTLSRQLQHSESHVALVGADKFGYRRLLRIFCHHTHLPLAILFNGRGYDKDGFLQDMKTIITFACQNDARTAVYVPEAVLSIPGVARVVDGIIANGDISDLFNKEERLALHRGFTVNSAKSLRTLTLSEDADLRRRVRRGVSFILQLSTTATMRDLADGYPAMEQVSIVHTTSAAHWKRSKEELVSAGLYGDDVDPAIVEQPLEEELRRYGGQLKLRGKTLIQVVCDVYQAVTEEFPVVTEQLSAFAQQLRRFRSVEQVDMQRAAYAARAISTRGDTATVEMNDCIEQRKSAAKELADTQSQIKKLKSRLVTEEEANETFQKSAKEAEAQLREEEAHLLAKETGIREAQEAADDAVVTASARLRRVKGAQLRTMKSMRLPEKGILLIRAVYKLLGQELPKHNGPTDLWFTAANVMSEPVFANAVAALDPNRVTDVGPLLSVLREVGEVRYGKVFPYGQLLADFVVAYIESARVRIVVNAPLLEKLSEERAAFTEMRKDVEGLYSKARGVLETASMTQESIVALETRVAALAKLQTSLDQRGKRLSRYVGAVDRLMSFLSKNESEDKGKWAATAEGDCILLATFSSLLAPHHSPLRAIRRIQALLDKHGVAYSPDGVRPFASLLTAGNPTHMDFFLSLSALPERQQLALALLYRRATPTWMLLGGVCPMFERKLVEVTRQQSRGCAVLSAFEGYLPDRLTQCMRDGEGVLLRDVFTPAGLALLHQLDPLRLKLHEWNEAVRRDRKQQQQQQNSHHAASTAATSDGYRSDRDGKTVRMPYRIFGRDVEVHPDFYVIATSSAPVPVRDIDRLTTMPTPTKCMTVFNFYVAVSRETRYTDILLRMPAAKNVVEELQEINTRLYREMVEYKVKYDAAAAVVALPLDQLASNGDAAIDTLESILLDFEFHFNQIGQLQTQSQNVRRRQREEWGAVMAPLNALAEVVGFIEHEKMGRLWGDGVLDAFIRCMPHLSPALVSRLSPQRFDDLAKEQQRFYALFNYTQNVLECLACGWPRPLRGLYSLLALNAVVLASPDIANHRGITYSQAVEFLTKPQLDALRAILAIDGTRCASVVDLMDDGETAGGNRPASILQIYEASHDELLMRIARNERDSLGADSFQEEMSVLVPSASSPAPPFLSQFTEDVSLCADLFRALLALDVATAEQIALTMCITFSHSVLDSRTLSGLDGGGGQHPGQALSGDRSSHRRTGHHSEASSVVLHGPKRRGNSSVPHSSAASETMGMTHGGGGVRGDLLELAAQGDVKVHSHAELTTFCTRETIATCIPTSHVDEVLKELRHRANDAHLTHHWLTVTNTADAEATRAALMTYFHTREMTKKGHWAILEVAPQAAMKTGSPQHCEFSEAVLYVLTSFHSRATHGALGGDVEPVIPVRLTVVCGHATWAMLLAAAASRETDVAGLAERESVAAPCLIISRGFVTPRYHLLSLLDKEGVQEGCELNTTKKRRVDTEDDTRTSLRKPPSARELDAQQLERFCLLLFKELAFLHVSVVEHTRYLRSEWRSIGGSFSKNLEHSLDVEGDDDNLLTFLRVVRGWARRLNRVDGDAWVSSEQTHNLISTGSSLSPLNRRHLDAISASRGGNSGVNTTAARGDSAAAADASARHAHRHALNLYRQRRLAWQLMTLEGRESQTTNVFRPAFMEEEKTLRPSKRLPSQGELMKRHCIHATYLLFQKIAYLFVARLAERASENVSVLHIIRHRICGPSPEHTTVFINVDQLLHGSTGLTAQRLLHMTGAEPELVRLDMESGLADLRVDISRLHSQLLGLCEYPAAVEHYEARRQAMTNSLLFALSSMRGGLGDPSPAVVVTTPPSACLSRTPQDTALPTPTTQDEAIPAADSAALAQSELAALLKPTPKGRSASVISGNPPSSREKERLAWTLEKDHLARLYAAVQRLPTVDEAPTGVNGGESRRTSSTPGEVSPHSHAPGATSAAITKKSRDRVMLHMRNTCHTLNGTADTTPSLWLPCLRYPSLSFFFTAHYAHEVAAERETKTSGDGGEGSGVVLVITQRDLLQASDVVLVGAHLSPLLQLEVRRVTQWPASYFGAQASMPLLDSEASSSVVVAARVLRGGEDCLATQPMTELSGMEQKLLWNVVPPTQRATDVLAGEYLSPSAPPASASARPSTARPGNTENDEAASVFVTELGLADLAPTQTPDTTTTTHAAADTQRIQVITPAPLSVYTRALTIVGGEQDDKAKETLEQQWQRGQTEAFAMVEFIPGRVIDTTSCRTSGDATVLKPGGSEGSAPTLSPHGGSAHFVYIE